MFDMVFLICCSKWFINRHVDFSYFIVVVFVVVFVDMFFVAFINLCNRSLGGRSSTSTTHTHEGISFHAAADQPNC